MSSDIKKLVELAHRNNKVVFDSRAQPGDLSDRLMELLAHTMKVHFNNEKVVSVTMLNDEQTSYYLDSLKGTMVPDKNKLVLVTNHDESVCLLGNY
jgi:iron-sulfur cluster repair protein YtfE (RIC family)